MKTGLGGSPGEKNQPSQSRSERAEEAAASGAKKERTVDLKSKEEREAYLCFVKYWKSGVSLGGRKGTVRMMLMVIMVMGVVAGE